MFGFASVLAAKVRGRLTKPKNRILLIDHRLFWSRAYCTHGVKDIPLNVNLGWRPKAHDVTEEGFMPHSFRNDAGATFVKQVKDPRCDTDKTGCKYLSVLHKAIRTEGLKALEAGVHPSHLKYGIRKACEAVIEHLRHRAQVVSTFDEIAQVGTTAANGDRKIGKLIAEAMEKVGKDGPIVVFEDGKTELTLEVASGLSLKNWGAASPFFFDEGKKSCVLHNPMVIIHGDKLSNKNLVINAAEMVSHIHPLLIIAVDIKKEVVECIMQDWTCIQSRFCVVKPIELVEDWKEILQDIAALTKAKILVGRYGANETKDFGGFCEKAIVSHDEMIVIGGFLTRQCVKKRCDQLKSMIQLCSSDEEVKLLEERLVKLSRGVAVIKVGGSNKDKMSITLNNAVDAVKIALEDGIVPGGGVAFVHASKELDKLEVANSGQKIGVKLMQHALRMPLYTIASAAGFDGSVVVDKLLEQDNIDLGYDQTTGECMNMIKLGIIDPSKLVIRELECFCMSLRYHFRKTKHPAIE